MAISRRNVLTVLGGGAILAAGGAGAFLGTRTPTRALAPWEAAGAETEPRRKALSYAILAPNPHNRQPWVVDLSRDGEIAVWRDKARNLPETDPFDRQLTIGMGCFLELLTIAASQDGWTVAQDLFPEGENGPVAVARFEQGAAPDPLFAHVMDRRSCKEPFDARIPPESALAPLRAHAATITDAEEVAALRRLTWEAFEVEYLTERTLKESVDLMRIGRSEIEANPDGIDIGGPMMESLALFGLMSREAAMDPATVAHAEGLRMYDAMLAATPAYAVITTKGNSREDQIEAGRRWLRLNLTTTGLGLALHPVSQALQEYPEMAALRAEAHERLGEPGETVQMLGRLGYGPETPPSPRWPLETRLTNG